MNVSIKLLVNVNIVEFIIPFNLICFIDDKDLTILLEKIRVFLFYFTNGDLIIEIMNR